MSQTLTVPAPGQQAHEHQLNADPRRKLQLALAVLWLLDAILQLQPAMFGSSFPQMLSATAKGNPAPVATPVTWASTIIAHHEAPLNAAFAATQLLIALGIALRPTVKLALTASIAWSVSVWYLGEALGGLLTGTATPATGAPGAVILYAVLAILLWPADRAEHPPFAAARAVPPNVARAIWLLVWGTLSLLTVLSTAPTPAVPEGQPTWLAHLDTQAATLLSHPVPVAALLAIVAVAVYLPPRAARPVLLLALVLCAALWLAQAQGTLLTGTATDPNTAPLLALLTFTVWPSPRNT